MSNLPEQNKAPGAEPKKALGRGLAALINPSLKSTLAAQAQANAGDSANAEVNGARFESVDLKQIYPNPNQPRKIFDEEKIKELSESLKEQGLVQPIIVRRSGDHYEIVAGERRWRAAKLAELGKIPVIIRADKLTTLQNDLASLVENVQREQLTPLELATHYERMTNVHGMTQDQLATRMGVSRVAVANTLRLLRLPQEVKTLLSDKKITEGHARNLLALDTEKQMVEVANQVVNKGLSVRETEQEVRFRKGLGVSVSAVIPGGALSGAVPVGGSIGEEKESHSELEGELRQLFGTKVGVRSHAGRGTIEIYFTGPDSLHRLVHQLRGLAK